MLYRVVNERYLKHRPMLLTTNKPLAALGDVLHDGNLAEAILDASWSEARTSHCAVAPTAPNISPRRRRHPTREIGLTAFEGARI